MDRAKECVTGLLMLVIASGCCGTQETRFLSWIPRPPDIEARSYNIHDPFPDETAGPNTFTRPRTFIEPRTDTRKDFDLRFLKAANGFPQQRYSALDSPPATRTVRNEAPLWRDPQLQAPITTVPAW